MPGTPWGIYWIMAKKKRKERDLQRLLRLHVNYSMRAYNYGMDALHHRKTGNLKQAARSEERAKEWLAKAMKLERQ